MATKTWARYAEIRKDHPGEWEKITTPHPKTSLNPERLAYLKKRAEESGFEAEIRPEREGYAPQVLWVAWKGL